MTTIVRFNVPAEFIAELKANPPNVDPVVRVTWEYRTREAIAIKTVRIVATYLVERGVLAQIMRLEAYIGDDWGAPGEREKVNAKGDLIVEAITKAAAEAKIEIRAGLYEAGS